MGLGVNQFKDFLASIHRNDNLAAQARDLKILRHYCEIQTAATGDSLDFSDLLSIWSFAVDSNNDSICSAVPAALAQFYRTISTFLEFRESGLRLGHGLLKRDYIRLLERGLTAPRTKDHLISPCLRLLTEIVLFDGGALATTIFDKGNILFKRVDFLLDQQAVEDVANRRRPSVRRMALRLIIATLKMFDANAKAEFLAHGRIFGKCLRGLMNDGDDIVVDILKSIEAGLVEDDAIPRIVKARLLNQENLASLVALYNYELDPEHIDSVSRVRDAVHELLIKICTTRNGIVLPQTGWYPADFENRVDAMLDDDYVDLGLDSPFYTEEYDTQITVKNSALSVFAQSLKPENDTLQNALLLQILRTVPELVANYFSKRAKLSTASSDDPAWRSQFAFLFSVSQLPIPRNFGWRDNMPPSPPPVPVLVESILPRPLDRTILSKYFTSNDDLLVISAAKLLVVALGKVQNVLNLFTQKNRSSEWQQASLRLIEEILQRVPKLQEIANALQRTGKGNENVRMALLECLAVYHRVLPEATSGSRFDISAHVSDILSEITPLDSPLDPQQNLVEQVLHVVEIAQLSPVTRWWSKPDSETLSLFAQTLRFASSQAKNEVATKILVLLRSVANSAGFLCTDDLPFTAMQLSIATTESFNATSETWLVLDNAIHRAIQSPVKFLDRVEAIQPMVSGTKPLSLLAVAVAEQWSFALKKHGNETDKLKDIATWIVRLYSALDAVGENYHVMHQLQDEMEELAKEKLRSIFQEAAEEGRTMHVVVHETITSQSSEIKATPSQASVRSVDLNETFGVPNDSTNSLEGIDRWNDKTDVELALQTGKIARLLRCSASVEEEIRKQAFQSLQGLSYFITMSAYDEKIQAHLLIGELIETIRQHGMETPLPSIAAELAVRILQIITDPGHKMYGKANHFLLRAPSWELKNLISYWIREIMFHEPENDDAGSWTDEIEWLLQWLAGGLKTSADMEMYRRSGVFEKVLSLYTKPGLARSTKRLLLVLIWRGILADGADILITRFGIQNWLKIAMTVDKDHDYIVKQLDQELRDNCHMGLIETWQKSLPVLRTENE